MITHYQSSKGPVEIVTMPLRYANNALAKLRRDEPGRSGEIDAIAAHIATFDTLPVAHEVAAEDNPRAVIGGNMPPEEIDATKLSGRAAIDAHVIDLLDEAANWADGVAIESQGQADSVSRLRRMLQQAKKAVDDSATEEKRPHNEAIAEIGTWQNGYTAEGLKKTPDGKITKTLAVLGRLDTAWLLKLDKERKAREAAIAAEAAQAAAEALAAREEAEKTTDIAVVDDAQDKLAAARSLLRQAEGISRERVHSGGGDGFRASGLRTFYIATPTGAERAWTEALNHYLKNDQFAAELRAMIQRYASRDAATEATRVLGIPGFAITEEQRAA